MGSIPLPALAAQAPQQPNTLDTLARIMQMKQQQQLMPGQVQQQQQQIQAGALENQARQRDLDQTQAVNNAYHDAITQDENGNAKIDTGKLTDALAKSNHGAAIPGIIKNINDYQKSAADLQESQSKAQSAARDSMGFLGQAIQQSKYDPHLADVLIEQRLRQPGLPQQEAQQLQQVRQQMQQNPQMLQTITDNLVAQSAKPREVAAQETQANARMLGAQTQQAKQAPMPAQQIGFLNKQLQNRFQVLNPGQQLPPEYQVQPGANRQSYEDIDHSLQQLEQAAAQRAQRQNQNGTRSDLRSDKSYQFNSGQLEKVAAPVDQAISRMSRLQDALAQNSPQADALIGPELLSVMAGGSGSGLRMNEAEISRVVGGRSKWETLKSNINQWQLDPSKATTITDEQRKEIRSLVSEVNTKLTTKQGILDDARQSLIGTDDPNQHRQIVANARTKMTQIDQGPQQPSGGGLQVGQQVTLKNGSKVTIKAVHPDGTFDAQ